jgi:hypothetical protein
MPYGQNVIAFKVTYFQDLCAGPAPSALRQPAKVAPFAGGNGALLRKSAAGDFFQ